MAWPALACAMSPAWDALPDRQSLLTTLETSDEQMVESFGLALFGSQQGDKQDKTRQAQGSTNRGGTGQDRRPGEGRGMGWDGDGDVRWVQQARGGAWGLGGRCSLQVRKSGVVGVG